MNKTNVISFFCNTTIRTVFVGLPVPLLLTAVGIAPALLPAIIGSIASIAIKEGFSCLIPNSIATKPLGIGHAVADFLNTIFKEGVRLLVC